METTKKAICLISYQDEDDLDEFNEGKIQECEIKIHNKGDIGEVFLDYYDCKYWEVID